MSEQDKFEPIWTWPLGSVNECVNCGAPATHRAPQVGEPWMDRIWGLHWLRTICNASTRHTLVTRGKKQVCKMHFKLAEYQAKDEVAGRLLEQSKMNTRHAELVHGFNRNLEGRLKAAEGRIAVIVDMS